MMLLYEVNRSENAVLFVLCTRVWACALAPCGKSFCVFHCSIYAPLNLSLKFQGVLRLFHITKVLYSILRHFSESFRRINETVLF